MVKIVLAIYILLFTGLPVIHQETGHLLYGRIYILAAISVFITYMVIGYYKKIPVSQLLLGASAFFLFFTLGSRLSTFTSGDWNQLLACRHWPGAGSRTILGGLAGLLAGMLLYASWTRNDKTIFDVLAIVLPVGLSIQRIGCLLSGCCNGIPTHLPWGIRYDQHSLAWNSQVISGQITAADPSSLPVHPVQLYEIIAWILILFISARVVRYFRAPGNRFFLVILLYGVFRFLLEFLRDPQYDLFPGSYWGVKYIQWMILAGLPLPAFIIIFRERRADKGCYRMLQDSERIVRNLILALIVVTIFLLTWRLFDLQEMVALSLLLTSLFITTAINVLRRNKVPAIRQGTIFLLSGCIVTGLSFI